MQPTPRAISLSPDQITALHNLQRKLDDIESVIRSLYPARHTTTRIVVHTPQPYRQSGKSDDHDLTVNSERLSAYFAIERAEVIAAAEAMGVTITPTPPPR